MFKQLLIYKTVVRKINILVCFNFNMEVILDSSFIISCVREGIDFIEQFETLGYKMVVPREVMQEMKDLRLNSKSSHEDRFSIDIALELIRMNKLKKMTIGQGTVDDKLIHLGKKGIYIATLDKAIKKQVPNKFVISTSTKSVVLERD
jgi:rRNA-processing protein FCF1